MNSSKAQIITQVIIFILAAIIFGLILLYGYQAIHGFLKKSQDIALATFYQDITNAVQTIKRDYGSVTRLQLTLPKKYTYFCIADPSNDQGKLNTRMHQAWLTGTENIFLTPPAPNPMKIEDITILQGAFCLPNSGTITLWLEGLGDKAQVTKQPP